MRLVITLIVLLLSAQSLFGQTKKLELKRDSLLTKMFRSLWIECSKMGELGDTTITYTDVELNTFYSSVPISDSLFAMEPKLANTAAEYFEIKTGYIRPLKRQYSSYSYLTYDLIKRWEIWYVRNRIRISFMGVVKDLNAIDRLK